MKIFKNQVIKMSGANEPGKVRISTSITKTTLRYKLFEAIKEELGLPDLSLEISAIAMDENGHWDININVPVDVAKELVGNVA